MPDKPPSNRPQLNIRLDKHPDLLDSIKQAASDRNTSASQFILDAILTALGKPTTTPTDTPSIEATLAEIDKLIDTKLDERLGDFERRLLEQFRQGDRQPPPEQLIEIPPEASPDDRPETRQPDYQAVRDRVLKTFTTGRGRIATSAPQYKSAAKALDRFIRQLDDQ